MKRSDIEALDQGKKVKTIVSKYIYDPESGKEKEVYYYAMLSLKNGVASVEVDNTHPLSDDEVDEFNKKNQE